MTKRTFGVDPEARENRELDNTTPRRTLADQGLASLIVPKGLHELVSGAAQAAGMTHPELVALFESDIRDLMAGRLCRMADPDDAGRVEVFPPLPSLLDRLKERAHKELEAKLGALLQPVTAK